MKLTRAQLATYRSYPPDAGAMLAFLRRHGHDAPVEAARIAEALPLVDRFYEFAEARDTAFVENTVHFVQGEGNVVQGSTLQVTRDKQGGASSSSGATPSTSLRAGGGSEVEKPPDAVLLVIGGFHTDGVTAQFRERGVPYVVVTPTAVGEHDESLYQRVVRGHTADLQSLIDAVRGVDKEALGIKPPTSEGQSFMTHWVVLALALVAIGMIPGDSAAAVLDAANAANLDPAVAESLAQLADTTQSGQPFDPEVLQQLYAQPADATSVQLPEALSETSQSLVNATQDTTSKLTEVHPAAPLADSVPPGMTSEVGAAMLGLGNASTVTSPKSTPLRPASWIRRAAAWVVSGIVVVMLSGMPLHAQQIIGGTERDQATVERLLDFIGQRHPALRQSIADSVETIEIKNLFLAYGRVPSGETILLDDGLVRAHHAVQGDQWLEARSDYNNANLLETTAHEFGHIRQKRRYGLGLWALFGGLMEAKAERYAAKILKDFGATPAVIAQAENNERHYRLAWRFVPSLVSLLLISLTVLMISRLRQRLWGQIERTPLAMVKRTVLWGAVLISIVAVMLAVYWLLTGSGLGLFPSIAMNVQSVDTPHALTASVGMSAVSGVNTLLTATPINGPNAPHVSARGVNLGLWVRWFLAKAAVIVSDGASRAMTVIRQFLATPSPTRTFVLTSATILLLAVLGVAFYEALSTQGSHLIADAIQSGQALGPAALGVDVSSSLTQPGSEAIAGVASAMAMPSFEVQFGRVSGGLHGASPHRDAVVLNRLTTTLGRKRYEFVMPYDIPDSRRVLVEAYGENGERVVLDVDQLRDVSRQLAQAVRGVRTLGDVVKAVDLSGSVYVVGSVGMMGGFLVPGNVEKNDQTLAAAILEMLESVQRVEFVGRLDSGLPDVAEEEIPLSAMSLVDVEKRLGLLSSRMAARQYDAVSMKELESLRGFLAEKERKGEGPHLIDVEQVLPGDLLWRVESLTRLKTIADLADGAQDWDLFGIVRQAMEDSQSGELCDFRYIGDSRGPFGPPMSGYTRRRFDELGLAGMHATAAGMSEWELNALSDDDPRRQAMVERLAVMEREMYSEGSYLDDSGWGRSERRFPFTPSRNVQRDDVLSQGVIVVPDQIAEQRLLQGTEHALKLKLNPERIVQMAELYTKAPQNVRNMIQQELLRVAERERILDMGSQKQVEAALLTGGLDVSLKARLALLQVCSDFLLMPMIVAATRQRPEARPASAEAISERLLKRSEVLQVVRNATPTSRNNYSELIRWELSQLSPSTTVEQWDRVQQIVCGLIDGATEMKGGWEWYGSDVFDAVHGLRSVLNAAGSSQREALLKMWGRSAQSHWVLWFKFLGEREVVRAIAASWPGEGHDVDDAFQAALTAVQWGNVLEVSVANILQRLFALHTRALPGRFEAVARAVAELAREGAMWLPSEWQALTEAIGDERAPFDDLLTQMRLQASLRPPLTQAYIDTDVSRQAGRMKDHVLRSDLPEAVFADAESFGQWCASTCASEIVYIRTHVDEVERERFVGWFIALVGREDWLWENYLFRPDVLAQLLKIFGCEPVVPLQVPGREAQEERGEIQPYELRQHAFGVQQPAEEDKKSRAFSQLMAAWLRVEGIGSEEAETVANVLAHGGYEHIVQACAAGALTVSDAESILRLEAFNPRQLATWLKRQATLYGYDASSRSRELAEHPLWSRLLPYDQARTLWEIANGAGSSEESADGLWRNVWQIEEQLGAVMSPDMERRVIDRSEYRTAGLYPFQSVLRELVARFGHGDLEALVKSGAAGAIVNPVSGDLTEFLTEGGLNVSGVNVPNLTGWSDECVTPLDGAGPVDLHAAPGSLDFIVVRMPSGEGAAWNPEHYAGLLRALKKDGVLIGVSYDDTASYEEDMGELGAQRIGGYTVRQYAFPATPAPLSQFTRPVDVRIEVFRVMEPLPVQELVQLPDGKRRCTPAQACARIQNQAKVIQTASFLPGEKSKAIDVMLRSFYALVEQASGVLDTEAGLRAVRAASDVLWILTASTHRGRLEDYQQKVSALGEQLQQLDTLQNVLTRNPNSEVTAHYASARLLLAIQYQRDLFEQSVLEDGGKNMVQTAATYSEGFCSAIDRYVTDRGWQGRLTLFTVGSLTRGTATPASDIDLLVAVDEGDAGALQCLEEMQKSLRPLISKCNVDGVPGLFRFALASKDATLDTFGSPESSLADLLERALSFEVLQDKGSGKPDTYPLEKLGTFLLARRISTGPEHTMRELDAGKVLSHLLFTDDAHGRNGLMAIAQRLIERLKTEEGYAEPWSEIQEYFEKYDKEHEWQGGWGLEGGWAWLLLHSLSMKETKHGSRTTMMVAQLLWALSMMVEHQRGKRVSPFVFEQAGIDGSFSFGTLINHLSVAQIDVGKLLSAEDAKTVKSMQGLYLMVMTMAEDRPKNLDELLPHLRNLHETINRFLPNAEWVLKREEEIRARVHAAVDEWEALKAAQEQTTWEALDKVFANAHLQTEFRQALSVVAVLNSNVVNALYLDDEIGRAIESWERVNQLAPVHDQREALKRWLVNYGLHAYHLDRSVQIVTMLDEWYSRVIQSPYEDGEGVLWRVVEEAVSASMPSDITQLVGEAGGWQAVGRMLRMPTDQRFDKCLFQEELWRAQLWLNRNLQFQLVLWALEPRSIPDYWRALMTMGDVGFRNMAGMDAAALEALLPFVDERLRPLVIRPRNQLDGWPKMEMAAEFAGDFLYRLEQMGHGAVSDRYDTALKMALAAKLHQRVQDVGSVSEFPAEAVAQINALLMADRDIAEATASMSQSLFSSIGQIPWPETMTGSSEPFVAQRLAVHDLDRSLQGVTTLPGLVAFAEAFWEVWRGGGLYQHLLTLEESGDAWAERLRRSLTVEGYASGTEPGVESFMFAVATAQAYLREQGVRGVGSLSQDAEPVLLRWARLYGVRLSVVSDPHEARKVPNGSPFAVLGLLHVAAGDVQATVLTDGLQTPDGVLDRLRSELANGARREGMTVASIGRILKRAPGTLYHDVNALRRLGLLTADGSLKAGSTIVRVTEKARSAPEQILLVLATEGGHRFSDVAARERAQQKIDTLVDRARRDLHASMPVPVVLAHKAGMLLTAIVVGASLWRTWRATPINGPNANAVGDRLAGAGPVNARNFDPGLWARWFLVKATDKISTGASNVLDTFLRLLTSHRPSAKAIAVLSSLVLLAVVGVAHHAELQTLFERLLSADTVAAMTMTVARPASSRNGPASPFEETKPGLLTRRVDNPTHVDAIGNAARRFMDYLSRYSRPPYVKRTPLKQLDLSNSPLNSSGAQLLVKDEAEQYTGSFKPRFSPWIIWLKQLPIIGWFIRALISPTTGNHGIATARLAKLLGIKAIIVAMIGAFPNKIVKMVYYGARVIQHHDYHLSDDQRNQPIGEFEEAVGVMHRLMRELFGVKQVSHGAWGAILGYGASMGPELVEDLRQAGIELKDVVFYVQLGAGGLAVGPALCLKAVDPRVTIVAVSTTDVPHGYDSMKAGQIVKKDSGRGESGIRTGELDADAFKILMMVSSNAVTVSSNVIPQAMEAFEAQGILTEDAGVVGFAAAEQFPELLGKGKVGVVINSGKNSGKRDDHHLIMEDAGRIDAILQEQRSPVARVSRLFIVAVLVGSSAALLGMLAQTPLAQDARRAW